MKIVSFFYPLDIPVLLLILQIKFCDLYKNLLRVHWCNFSTCWVHNLFYFVITTPCYYKVKLKANVKMVINRNKNQTDTFIALLEIKMVDTKSEYFIWILFSFLRSCILSTMATTCLTHFSPMSHFQGV